MNQSNQQSYGPTRSVVLIYYYYKYLVSSSAYVAQEIEKMQIEYNTCIICIRTLSKKE